MKENEQQQQAGERCLIKFRVGIRVHFDRPDNVQSDNVVIAYLWGMIWTVGQRRLLITHD
jgi:hypothetical protein